MAWLIQIAMDFGSEFLSINQADSSFFSFFFFFNMCDLQPALHNADDFPVVELAL